LTVENFGRSTHPDILAKTLADGDNKSFLLVHTKLIVAWLHGDHIESLGIVAVSWQHLIVYQANCFTLGVHSQSITLFNTIF